MQAEASALKLAPPNQAPTLDKKLPMRWYFGLFVVSGFCSILYEVIWLRAAMAQFGVTTPIVSLVLSSFMIGLGLGSYGSGYIVRKYVVGGRSSPLRLYALTELLIGISAAMVPLQLVWGREGLLRAIHQMSFSSSFYYLPAGLWIAATLVPWCACMGATFPFAMAAIRQQAGPDGERSFSYLYLANVLGALSGAIVPLFLIELFGFHKTLLVGTGLNFLLAACAFSLSLDRGKFVSEKNAPRPLHEMVRGASDGRLLWLLFGTGLTSMGAEVVWVRIYTFSLGTVVYAFAAILSDYLIGTYIGSRIYRKKIRGGVLDSNLLWVGFGISVIFAYLTADPRVPLHGVLRVLFGITPFAMLAGFITPLILDRFSAGDPDRAGRAYAINIAGCVLGPLLAGFILLPLLGEKLALCLFALPWLIVGLSVRPVSLSTASSSQRGSFWASPAFSYVLAVASIALTLGAKGYEEQYSPRWIRRDSTATVVSHGSGMDRRLLVNGVGMTRLSPITKMMAHLPLAFLTRPPEKALVICFGMGTSELAMLSWGIHATAVELVPSVPKVVTFFHPDADKLLQPPLAEIVIDDGRAFLERSSEQFDVITTDPPPPVEAAASSLLYSKEFYAIVKPRLREGGILQEWFPGGDAATTASVARAISESFPYVRAFPSVEGWGIHFLASMSPIPDLSAADLAARLPSDAARNLVEWGPASTAREQFDLLVSHELSVPAIIQQNPAVAALRDDFPVNEYFLIRKFTNRTFKKRFWHFLWRNMGVR
jgi:spermidine synthase